MNEQLKAKPPRSVYFRAVLVFAGIVGAYLVVAYVVLPLAWKRYTHTHPSVDEVPNITLAPDGIPGDPLNVGLVGSEEEVMKAMVAAKWYPADPLTLKSCLRIASATVLKRPYDEAPVSSLFLFDRKEDLAFEMPVGDDPRQRHHVRFWKTKQASGDGRILWIGSATYDRRVGLSGTTGEITHHIAADVDTERDHLLANLKAAGQLIETYREPGFHKVRHGKNGGGDPWETDGDLAVGVIIGSKAD